MTTEELDALEAAATDATWKDAPPGENGKWWMEGEDVVEGFEGAVAKCERYEVTSFVAAANPAAVQALVREIRFWRKFAADALERIGSDPEFAARILHKLTSS